MYKRIRVYLDWEGLGSQSWLLNLDEFSLTPTFHSKTTYNGYIWKHRSGVSEHKR